MPESLQKQINRLANDRFSSVDIVPDDESIEIIARSKENAALRGFRQTVREADVFASLWPTRQQENIDHKSTTG